jgi:hypothetical protein
MSHNHACMHEQVQTFAGPIYLYAVQWLQVKKYHTKILMILMAL